MPASKYLTADASGEKLKSATVSSAGAANAYEIPALDASGKLDLTVMPVGVGPESDMFPTSENLSAGDYINIYNAAGVPTVRKADASNGRTADGFVKSAVTAPTAVAVYRDGANANVTGRTIGAVQYLSVTVPGATQETAPVGVTEWIQEIGKATDTTVVSFKPKAPIYIAS